MDGVGHDIDAVLSAWNLILDQHPVAQHQRHAIEHGRRIRKGVGAVKRAARQRRRGGRPDGGVDQLAGQRRKVAAAVDGQVGRAGERGGTGRSDVAGRDGFAQDHVVGVAGPRVLTDDGKTYRIGSVQSGGVRGANRHRLGLGVERCTAKTGRRHRRTIERDPAQG